MGKIADRYLEIEPWGLAEKGFHPERNQVSESLFSLGNEYCGVRGFFEEGVSLPSLIGTYYNGIIEYAREDVPTAYRGIPKRSHFTINSTNFLRCSLNVGGERLDLARSKHRDFLRTLDFRTGLLERSFVWEAKNGDLKVIFRRALGMESPHEAVQEIALRADRPLTVELTLSLDGTILHWGDHCYWERGEEYRDEDDFGLFEHTPTTGQSLLTLMRIASPVRPADAKLGEKTVDVSFVLPLEAGKEVTITRYVVNIADRESPLIGTKKEDARREMDGLAKKGLKGLLEENRAFFSAAFDSSDIEIEGDPEDQQGIRFCLFSLLQAYTGLSGNDNIGAKGLTGEAYSGHAFWDSETYCLPYYLFTNQKAARDLLLFRYNTLEQAKERAKEIDCEGACYPIATRDGREACTLWQHALTQIQPTTGVAYAIAHYENVSHDEAFLRDYGAEMLAEIAKFLLSRGQWNASHTHFGYYGVMGPDEFEVMVNHNTYTNYMAKRTLEYAMEVLKNPKYGTPALLKKCGITEKTFSEMRECAEKMLILYDPKTHLFEQHQGYYDLPHIDVGSIPVTDFPLYDHWSYDRIFRNDMIKQPDVLMFIFLYDQSFDFETKKANFDFYEPRCIHESSLSPSVHSILAEELGYEDKALDFFGFATRLDLDDYNRNTKEGLHMTSITAAWMTIVYGFLGLRSEEGPIKIDPKLPKRWESYSVRLIYRGAKLRFTVKTDSLRIEHEGEPAEIVIYGKPCRIDKPILEIPR